MHCAILKSMMVHQLPSHIGEGVTPGGGTGVRFWGTDSLGGDGGKTGADAIYVPNQGARTDISDLVDE